MPAFDPAERGDADASPPHAGRSVLLAGGTGLVGRALLQRLQADPRSAHLRLLLRRPAPSLPQDARTEHQVVDFERLAASAAAWPTLDDAYIALGTTIRLAGSQAAFRQVDFDHVVAVAGAARAAGASRLAVVSALGADARSRTFYNRVKGDMEAAVRALGFQVLVIARPSLILGDRAALGQPGRAAEGWAIRLTRPLAPLLPEGVRPIEATRVAAAMVAAIATAAPGVTVLGSGSMQSAS